MDDEESLDAAAVRPLIEVLREESQPAVKVAACQALSYLPLEEDAVAAAGPAIHEMLDAIEPGTAAWDAAVAAARLVPEPSIRKRLPPPPRPPAPNRLSRLAQLVADRDPRAAPVLVEMLDGDEREWAASQLARLPIEDLKIRPRAFKRALADGDLFAAIAVARLGKTRPLLAAMRRICSDDPPRLFWGSPWAAYDELAAVRPVPESLQAWLRRQLDHEWCHQAKVLIWAVTGIADAQGFPLESEPEAGAPEPPEPIDPGTSERVARALIERPFDEDGELTVSYGELETLRSVPDSLVDPVVTSVVTEAGERIGVSGPVPGQGNQVTEVLAHLPPERLPLGKIYALTREPPEPVLADQQLGWLVARSGPTHAVAEIAPLVRVTDDVGAQLDMLGMIAASAEPASPSPPPLGAGPTAAAAAPPALGVPGEAHPAPPPPAPPGSPPQQQEAEEPAPTVGSAAPGRGTTMPYPGAVDAGTGDTRTAWPHLVCPDEVVAGERLTLEVGLRSDQLTEIFGTGALTLPAEEFELDVELSIDGFELLAGERRLVLRVGEAAQLPLTVTVPLLALAGGQLRPVRTIGASFFVGGSLRGYAARLVRVVATADELGHEPPPKPPEADGTVELGADALKLPPDLTIQIRHGDDAAHTKLLWTARSPLVELDLPAEAPRSDIGERPDLFARRIIDTCSTMSDPLGLLDYLVGTGRSIAEKIPAAVQAALRALCETVGERVPTVLIISEDPYVPWELAVFDDPPLRGADESSPFLGGQLAIGRWPLSSDRPPPRPEPSLQIRDRAVISGKYDRVAGWKRLEHAEAEAEALARGWPGSQPVDASYLAVRGALRGAPGADLLHFALHGQFAPEGLQEGLVLIDRDPQNPDKPPAAYFLRPEQVRAGRFKPRTPFVFLNACQVGAGARVLGDYAGMAEAFLSIGATSVIAPLWSINDEVAREAACGFYGVALHAASADAPSVAEVLRRARAAFTERAVSAGEGARASTYLAYQFFGHPRLVLQS